MQNVQGIRSLFFFVFFSRARQSLLQEMAVMKRLTLLHKLSSSGSFFLLPNNFDAPHPICGSGGAHLSCQTFQCGSLGGGTRPEPLTLPMPVSHPRFAPQPPRAPTPPPQPQSQIRRCFLRRKSHVRSTRRDTREYVSSSRVNKYTLVLQFFPPRRIQCTRSLGATMLTVSLSCVSFQNSIRHNLSLHNRFMRIQNEGTGKSSWWVLNPDAKPGQYPGLNSQVGQYLGLSSPVGQHPGLNSQRGQYPVSSHVRMWSQIQRLGWVGLGWATRIFRKTFVGLGQGGCC